LIFGRHSSHRFNIDGAMRPQGKK